MNNVNNMYYDNYSNVNDIVNIKNEELIQKDLVNASEGFRRGNIFADLYWPYKKQTYNFVPNNDRQKLLLEIMENCFYKTHPFFRMILAYWLVSEVAMTAYAFFASS